MTFDEAIETLPQVWDLYTTAIFSGAVEADHPSGKTPDQVQKWAEREAEDAIERYTEEIEQDEEEDVNPPDQAELDKAETFFREVTLAAYHEVRKDYRARADTLRDLDEIASVVAERLGFDLPDDFSTGTLQFDRFRVIR